MQHLRLCTSPLRGLNSYVSCSTTRTFSFTALRFEDEKVSETTDIEPIEAEASEESIEAETPKEPVKLSNRRRNFHSWMEATGKKFSRPSEGTTNYLGATPFPNNPLFQPRPPLSDITKQHIYDAFTSESQNWTGVALQKKFSKGMEQLMGVDRSIELLKEPLVDIFPNVGKPKFKTVKEDTPFTPEDAAKVLNRLPYKDLEKRVIEIETANFSLPKPVDQTKKQKKKFVIMDTSV
ncbi:hypothetical protein BY458DRAFT_531679 [Sporodiniella umbellata]|nr:hypothetical protein BY458DRAFT_531679 [Sporodiniella umbellata]